MPVLRSRTGAGRGRPATGWSLLHGAGRAGVRPPRGRPRRGPRGPARTTHSIASDASRRPGGTSQSRISTRSRVGDASARRAGCRAAQGVPTHSSVPSANAWCFQIGTSALRRVDQRPGGVERLAAVGRRRSRTMTAMSPISSVPVRCTAASAEHVVLDGDLLADLAQPVEGAGVGGVVEAGDALAAVVVADPARRTGSPRRRRRRRAAASTSATSSGVSRRSTRRTARPRLSRAQPAEVRRGRAHRRTVEA